MSPQRSADVLLTHAYYLSEDEHERRYMRPYVPLGILYISAWLKARGFGVEVLDTTFESPDDVRAAVAASSAPVVGVYANLMTRGAVVDLCRVAHAAGKVVVIGGPDAAGYPDQYLDHGADVVVFGEGEETLRELLEALPGSGPHALEHVAGVAYRSEGGEVRVTHGRAALPDLGALPWPDRDAVDIGAYLDCWRSNHGEGSVSLITARGCPYRCRWCSHAVYGYTHRRRPARDVAAEIGHIRERYAPDMLWFADDVFSISYRWLKEFAPLMRAAGPPLPFETITRADRVTDEVVTLMAELGCKRVWLGSESGSQRVLDAMERGVTIEQIRWATRAFQAAGVEVGLFLMWGYEGEGPDDIAATIDHVVATGPDRFLTTVAYPIGGTPYAGDVEPRIEAPSDWVTSSDRDHKVRGRPSKKYYSYASDRLNAEVALRSSRAANRPSAPVALAAIARARFGMWRTRHEVEA